VSRSLLGPSRSQSNSLSRFAGSMHRILRLLSLFDRGPSSPPPFYRCSSLLQLGRSVPRKLPVQAGRARSIGRYASHPRFLSSSPRSICTPADFMFWSPAGHGAARLYRPDPALRRRSSPVVAACLCEGMEAQAETSKAGSFDLALSCLIYLVLTFVLNRSIQSSLCLLGVIWSAPLSGLPRSKEDLSPYLDPSSVRSTFCNAFYSGSFEQLNGGTVRTLPPT
jgi:hypothetical protein